MSKSKARRKKKSSAGKNVAIFFIVFVILEALLIFGLTRIFKNQDSHPSLGGYTFFIMDSDNMGSSVPKNALVIAENGTPSPDKCGFAVLCKNVKNEGTTVGWLYSIGSKGDTVDGVIYTVYQEKSPDKMYDLTSDDIIGVTASYYMTAGQIVAFAVTPFGMAICLGAPIVLLVLLELIIAMTRRSGNDYDDDDDDDDDNDNVTLDDFLYGGKDDQVYTTTKPKDTYEEEFESNPYASLLENEPAPAPQQFAEPAPEFEAEPAPVYDEAPVQPVEEAEPVGITEELVKPTTQEIPVVSENTNPNIDPSYYERASKMIDDAVAGKPAEEAAAPAEPAPAPVAAEPAAETAKPSARPDAQMRRQGAPNGQRRRPAGARPNGQRRPRPRPAATGERKDANAAIEELMKMMEDEQKKLKEASANKDE